MSDGHGSMYDDFAEAFARHAEGGSFNALYDRPALLDLLGDVHGLQVLDVGCGPGLYALELIQRGACVTAFDSSAEMVRLASARVGAACDVRHASLEEPLNWLADGSQDAAVMALVLHHVDGRAQAFAELFRVLRPGGCLVLSTVHPTSDWLRHGGSYFATELIEETWGDNWKVRYWRQPLDGWCREFTDAGFMIERLIETRPLPAMAQQDQRHYEQLQRQPEFITLRLVKPGVGRS